MYSRCVAFKKKRGSDFYLENYAFLLCQYATHPNIKRLICFKELFLILSFALYLCCRRPKTPKKTMPKFRASVKDPIVVYCRIRPLDNPMDNLCIKTKDEKTVVLVQPEVSQNTRLIKEVKLTIVFI